MKREHTSGPWELSFNNHSYTINGPGCRIVHVSREPVVLQGTWDRQVADAHLIASAPEMLQALKAIDSYNERGIAKGEPRISPTFANMVKQAIAKAEETP